MIMRSGEMLESRCNTTGKIEQNINNIKHYSHKKQGGAQYFHCYSTYKDWKLKNEFDDAKETKN